MLQLGSLALAIGFDSSSRMRLRQPTWKACSLSFDPPTRSSGLTLDITKCPYPMEHYIFRTKVQELEYRLLKYHLYLSPCAINTDNVVLDPTEAISRVTAPSFFPELVSSQASVGVGRSLTWNQARPCVGAWTVHPVNMLMRPRWSWWCGPCSWALRALKDNVRSSSAGMRWSRLLGEEVGPDVTDVMMDFPFLQTSGGTVSGSVPKVITGLLYWYGLMSCLASNPNLLNLAIWFSVMAPLSRRGSGFVRLHHV